MKKEQSRTVAAFQNSAVGFASKIIILFLQFYARTVFLKYLGIELMGISSTFTSLLSTLSLAELGFESVVVFSLYKPLAERDEQGINDIISVLRVIYQSIGVMFIVAGIICLPILPVILKGVEVTWYIRAIFLVQVSNSAATYLLAYKRSLLYADKKAYISTIIDTIMNLVVEIMKIVLVIVTKEYMIYISLTTVQTICSNIIIHIVCGRLYPYLHRTQFNKTVFISIWEKVKNLFVAKIAYYVYASTDNLVISSLISTVAVGFTSNYLTVISSLKSISTSIINPVTPIIGNLIAADDNKVHQGEILKLCTFVRFVIAIAFIAPLMVLMQSFIVAWIGKKYLLSYIIVVLYSADLYIHIVHSALCDFINGSGLFKEERNVEIVGAFCNILTSVTLAAILRNISVEMGVIGVLIGTIVSQTVFWVYRSVITYRYCFPGLIGALGKYWVRNIEYIVYSIIMIVFLQLIYSKIHIDVFFIKFVITGAICEVLIGVTLIIAFGRTKEYVFLKSILEQKIPIFRRKSK